MQSKGLSRVFSNTTVQKHQFFSAHPSSPKAFSFPLQPNETVCFIEGDQVYIEAWIEEGWDDENDCATEEYKYYNKVITKDFHGDLLSEEIGALHQAADGTWWIS